MTPSQDGPLVAVLSKRGRFLTAESLFERNGRRVTLDGGRRAGASVGEMVLLGCLATRFPNTTLEWDTAGLRFGNEPEANRYLTRKYRPGWDLGEV